MIDRSLEVPEEFVDLVRDALLNLYDVAALQAHPLLSVVDFEAPQTVGRGQLLRRALLDGIESLQPSPGVTATSRTWRTYRILEARYIEGQEVAEVIQQVALSKSQYHREHQRALQGVATILWERWRLADNWASARAALASERSQRRESAWLQTERLATVETAKQIDVAETIQGVIGLLSLLSVREGIELKAILPERSLAIEGDRVALRQAVLLVLTRAIRESQGGLVEVTVRGEGDRVCIELVGRSNTGWRLSESDIEDCLPFVRALRGQADLSEGEADDERWRMRLTFRSLSRSLLLVVDNNRDFIAMVKRYLAGQQWEVVGAPDVEQAYALACHLSPRAILLDVVMPGRDGWDLLQQLKAEDLTRDIPVLVCSILEEPEIAIALGASAYLQKPLSQQRLIEVLNQIG